MYQADPQLNPSPQPELPSKKRRFPIVISVIALLLVIAILAGLLTNWFGFYGPTTKLLLSAKKTLSSESFTVHMQYGVGSYQPDPLDIQIQVDYEARELTLLGHYTDESIVRFAICDGFLIERTLLGRYSSKDIQPELDTFFDNCQKNNKPDWEELLKTVSPTLYEQYGDRLAYNKITPAMIRFLRLSNNPRWLKSTAGMTSEKSGDITTYRFHPDSYQAITDSLACFEPVFKSEQDFESVNTQLSQLCDSLDAADLEITFEITRGYLTGAEISGTRKEIELFARISVTDIDSTQINKEELSDLLSRSTRK